MNQFLKEKIKNLGNPYKILQCQPFSNLETITNNYRSLARKYHPDKNKTEEAKQIFLKLSQAYTILKDNDNKQEYDKYLTNISLNQMRFDAMGEDRKRFASQLLKRQKEAQKQQQQRQLQKIRKKRFNQQKQKEEEQRYNMKQQLLRTMQPTQYYEKINSIKVKWSIGYKFNDQLLKLAFNKYGLIKNIKLIGKDEASIEFQNIEVCEKIIKDFKHPKIEISFLIGQQKRKELLKAINTQRKEKLDFTLSSENIRRMTELINRNSNIYASQTSTKIDYQDIFRKENLL